MSDDFGTNALDPQERQDAETFLDDPNDSDDEPWSPPDRQPRGGEYADGDRETLEQRIAQEEPEVGARDAARSASRRSADDSDVEDDFLGDPDEYDDRQPVADPGRSAEQAAMHVIDDDSRYPDEEDVNGDSADDEEYDEEAEDVD